MRSCISIASFLSACWSGTPQIVVVHKVRYAHDAPMSCALIVNEKIRFPSAVDVGKPEYVSQLATWVTAAGICLGEDIYDVSWFVQPVRAEVVP